MCVADCMMGPRVAYCPVSVAHEAVDNLRVDREILLVKQLFFDVGSTTTLDESCIESFPAYQTPLTINDKLTIDVIVHENQVNLTLLVTFHVSTTTIRQIDVILAHHTDRLNINHARRL